MIDRLLGLGLPDIGRGFAALRYARSVYRSVPYPMHLALEAVPYGRDAAPVEIETVMVRPAHFRGRNVERMAIALFYHRADAVAALENGRRAIHILRVVEKEIGVVLLEIDAELFRRQLRDAERLVSIVKPRAGCIARRGIRAHGARYLAKRRLAPGGKGLVDHIIADRGFACLFECAWAREIILEARARKALGI